MTNRKRAYLFTALIVLGALLIASLLGYKIGSASLEADAKDNLRRARKIKAQELVKDIDYLNGDILSMAESPALKSFLQQYPKNQEQILNWLKVHGSESDWRSVLLQNYKNLNSSELNRAISMMSPLAVFLQAQYIKTSILQSTPAPKVFMPEGAPALDYFKNVVVVHSFLSRFYDGAKITDFILLNRDGVVVYTVQKGLDLGANLTTGVFSTTRLNQVYRWALGAKSGESKFFDYAPLAHFWPQAGAFLATPIFADGKFLGTILLQISVQRIDEILSRPSVWDTLGLQKTGEVALFGTDGFMRNTSRYFYEQPEKFLKAFSKFPEQNANPDQIRKSGTTALLVNHSKHKIDRYLSMGQVDEIDTDYMGVHTVLSGERIVLPGGTQWVLIAKINQTEFINPLNKHFYPILGLITILALVAFTTSGFFVKRVFVPMQGLGEALDKLKIKNFDALVTEPEHGKFKPIIQNHNQTVAEFRSVQNGLDYLRSVVHAIQVPFLIVEAQVSEGSEALLLIKEVNSTTAQLLEMPDSLLVGSELKLWMEVDYSPLHASLAEGGREYGHLEGDFKKLSGERIPFQISWSLVRNHGVQKVSFVIVGHDISTKRTLQTTIALNEQLLKQSQALAKTGSFRWNIATDKSFWTEETYNICGISTAKEASYDLFRSLIYSEDIAGFDRAFKESLKNMTPMIMDFRIRRKDNGEIQWIRVNSRTDYDEYGNPISMYGTIQNITDIRRVEQALVAAKNEALKSSQAKSEFLARMSHEIRTPMNAIMGMAELLKETKLDADQQYYVTIFCKAGEVLMALINDILDLSKIEAGEVSIENIPFDLKKLLVDVEEMMKPRALEKGLNYSFNMAQNLTPYLMGDPTKLRQVLINIVGNSLKFTEKGFIRLGIDKNPSKKDSLLITISDSGVGIPESKQQFIFQKFSQADSSITRRFGGTGLGLAISKSLVELMGGQIWFKSQEGSGTTFYLTIPYREQIYHPVTNKPIQHLDREPEVLTPKVRDPNKKIKILVADDTEDNRTLFIHYLKTEPFEIVEAENGLKAIDKIKSEQFDVVFMDVQMPEMDGYAATAEIRNWEKANNKPPIPIIALTAHALSEDRQKSLRAGCDDHIAKPFKKDTLLKVINRFA